MGRHHLGPPGELSPGGRGVDPPFAPAYDSRAPLIALFYGIRISMSWKEHQPAHFHAEYAGYRATVGIREGTVITGFLPRRQLKLVLAWAEIHADELMQDWELAREGKPLHSIEGLR